ncbi:unnamed protein product, partial [Musa hybrid cultivar]
VGLGADFGGRKHIRKEGKRWPMSRLTGDGGGAGRDLRTRSEPKLIGNKIA